MAMLAFCGLAQSVSAQTYQSFDVTGQTNYFPGPIAVLGSSAATSLEESVAAGRDSCDAAANCLGYIARKSCCLQVLASYGFPY